MSIFKAARWVLAGNIAFASAQWLVLIVLAKVSSATGLGSYALATAITAPVFAFANMNLRAIVATEVQEGFDSTGYFNTRVAMMLAAALFSSAIAWLLDIAVSDWILFAEVVCIKFLEGLCDITFGFRQRNEELHIVGTSMIARSTLMTTLVIITAFATHDAESIVGSVFAAYLIVFLSFDVRRCDRIRLDLKLMVRKQTATLIMIAAPLGGVVAINLLVLQVPRYTLAQYYGVDVVGYFSGLVYFVSIGSVVINAAGQASLTRLSRYFANDIPKFIKTYRWLLAVAALVGVTMIAGAACCGRTILAIVYTPEFAEHSTALVFIMIAGTALFMSAMTGVALTSAKQYKVQLFSSLGALAATAVMSFILIPHDPLQGAAIALICGYGAKLLVQAFMLRRAIARRAPY